MLREVQITHNLPLVKKPSELFSCVRLGLSLLEVMAEIYRTSLIFCNGHLFIPQHEATSATHPLAAHGSALRKSSFS